MTTTMRFSRFTTTLARYLLLISSSALQAGFDMNIEPETGFQTNVPDGRADTSFGSYPFCALGLEPSWATDTGKTFLFSFTSPLSATKYIGGNGEVNIAPELSLEKKSASHVTQAALGAAYHFMPAAYDPTVPENYLEYSFECRRNNTGKVPLTGTYGFFLLNDIATSRIDLKNVLQLRLNLGNSARIHGFIKTGCSWNVSNAEGAGYIQPLAAGGMTVAVNENDLLLVQLFASYSFYKPMNVPVLVTVGRGRWGKKTDTLVTYELSVPRIPFASLYCGYDRELSPHTNLHFYYMAALFGRGQPHSLLLSHQSGIIFSWHRK